SPEGSHVAPPLREGEGILTADLDLDLIVKRKRMMYSVGHYARPELLKLVLDNRAARPMEIAAEASSLTHEFIEGACDDSDATQSHAAGTTDQRVAVLRGSAR